MAFAPYWMQLYLPVSSKLKNGVHLVEAEEWRKGWWKVKPFGALRSKYISPRIWNANSKIPYTGQPFALAMAELHKLPQKEPKHDPKSMEGAAGPVCLIGGPEADKGEGSPVGYEGVSPDRVRRQRAVRKARATAPRKSYPKRRS